MNREEISEVLTDMIFNGSSKEELEEAINESIKIIDSEKH